jgi:hypothetical protein
MKRKEIISSGVLLFVSVALSLAFGETVSRVFLNPSDYLSVEMVADEVLGAVPSPNSLAGGFDAWGFRNPEVPETADIVAIGDSHTYGNTASMSDSWPSVLSALSGRRVYNMGMGGYGPNQYLHLLQTKALKLKPKTVLVGLYIGDDFENAFLITYGLDHWASLRELPAEKVNFDIWEKPPAPTWHKRARLWLSQNSLLYQLVVHGPLLGRLKGELQIKNASTLSADVTTISIPEKRLLEAFRPKSMLRLLDQNDSSVQEGMRITFALLGQMNSICRENGIEFKVVVIPTKEMVFAEYLEHKPELAASDVLDKLLANERIARERTFGFLTRLGIPFVDTLQPLRQSMSDGLYAKSERDMHPGRNGYRVIATAAFRAMSEPDGSPISRSIPAPPEQH